MSKKITHETIVTMVNVYMYGTDYTLTTDKLLSTILEYVVQQEKQEGLLELYKKLLKIEQDDFHEKYKGNSEEYFKAWNETFNKIKELEK